jgi:preprotein translocase subunit SecG
MRPINIIRRLAIAVIILFIVVILEAAYFGLHETHDYSVNGSAYSVAAPFVTNFSEFSSPANIIFLIIVFILSFIVVSNMITRKKEAQKARIKQVGNEKLREKVHR